jgi:hypothetical protein
MHLNENDADNVFIAMPSPSEIDILSPDVPVLLIEDKQGQHYEGQSGGVCCNHYEATGFVFNLYGAKELGEYLDGPHHNKWCGYIDNDGLDAIDQYFIGHNIPLRTTVGYHDEGWVSVKITEVSSSRWEYLMPYEGQRGVLIWNNCD